MNRPHSGKSQLGFAVLFFTGAAVLAFLRMPPLLTGGALVLAVFIGLGGFFGYFADYFEFLNEKAEQRHRELMGLLEKQHRESTNFIIGELRRIFPPATPPPNASPHPPDPGIQKLPRKNP